MRTIGVLVAVAALTCAALPARTDEKVAPVAPPASWRLALPPDRIEADGLDPALRMRLSPLLAAALESAGGYQVQPAAAQADWELRILVSGKGPWRLSARAVRPGSAASGRRAGDVATSKRTFANRDDLTRAIDEVAAELDAGLKAARGPSGEPPAAAAPVPLARALSPSSEAVDAYLDAMTALRAADVTQAREALERARVSDPSFCLAAAELAYLEFSEGRPDAAGRALDTARAAGPCRTADAEDAARGLDLVARDDIDGALRAAGALVERAPGLRWGYVIRGLALGARGRLREAAPDWRVAALLAPGDARGHTWLGLSLMATGDFKGAADALGRAREAWPGQLKAYTLQAEAQARMRETALARQTIEAMKSYMTAHGIAPDADERNPDLMLGSLDMLEGRAKAALERYDAALDDLEARGAPPSVTERMHLFAIEMLRDDIVSADAIVRSRQAQAARDAIEHYQSSETPERRLLSPLELLRLKGLVSVREGKTVEAWRIVEEIKSLAGSPGYSDYYEAHLSGVILLKEGDPAGGAAQLERAAAARGRILDMIDLAQVQGHLDRYDASRATYREVERRLAAYDPSPGPGPGPLGELILADPYLAGMIPIYHYTWARLGFVTNNTTESRLHFNQMLKYLQQPDEELMPLVNEARDRGARPE